MIQAWLAKNAVKLGVVGAIVALIFFSGFYVKGKMVEAKIVKLQNEIVTISSNYDIALSQNETLMENEKTLLAAIKETNDAIDALNATHEANMRRLRASHASILAAEREGYTNTLSDLKESHRVLVERFKALSASEACYEAWLVLLEE